MHNVIKVDHLSKAYRIGQRESMPDTMFDVAKMWATQPFRNLRNLSRLNTFDVKSDHETIHWALRDVTFEVQEGDVLGIIGHNGAGKSTLLKILSRITAPTEGRAEIHGRVSSLLEVGTGFHPELSGRENIYMNGTILGMRKLEIDRRFPEIVEFAGIDEYLDTPIKRYSSGMKVRLAFAVAAHLEPEILIIDEVLAVGDLAFQQKCMSKMGDVATSGRTVLFVSHNLAAVRSLCTSAVLLQGGRIVTQDKTETVVSKYYDQLNSDIKNQLQRTWPSGEEPGTKQLRLRSINVVPRLEPIIEVSSGFSITLEVECLEELPNLETLLDLKTMDNVTVLRDRYAFTTKDECRKGVYRVTIGFPGYLLNSGRYRIRLVFRQNQRYRVFSISDVLTFDIENSPDTPLMPGQQGIIRPRLTCQNEYIGRSVNDNVPVK